MSAPDILCLTSLPLRFNVAAVSQQELKSAAQLLGRRGGLAKSKAKAKAVKENGKKGGRPRKNQLVTIR